MSNPTRNRLALLGLRSFLKDNPAKHDQMQWAIVPREELSTEHRSEDIQFTCGTKACAAGWASLLAGDVIDPDSASYSGQGEGDQYLYRIHYVVTPKGKRVPIGSRAQKLLGLSHEVALALFHTHNSRAAILKALKMLIDGQTDAEVVGYLAHVNPLVVDDPIVIT